MVDWAVTDKTLYFGYLTYGSRTANQTDSPYQTVTDSWERLLGRIPCCCHLQFSRPQQFLALEGGPPVNGWLRKPISSKLLHQ